jgi:hypothetical protein
VQCILIGVLGRIGVAQVFEQVEQSRNALEFVQVAGSLHGVTVGISSAADTQVLQQLVIQGFVEAAGQELQQFLQDLEKRGTEVAEVLLKTNQHWTQNHLQFIIIRHLN